MLGHIQLAERCAVAEPQGAHGHIGRPDLEAAGSKVQLILAYVFERELVRRLPVVGTEVRHCSGLDLLRVRRHVANLHVIDHAPLQRRHLLGHRELPSLDRTNVQS